MESTSPISISEKEDPDEKMRKSEEDDEDDPVVETYTVLLKPELPAHQQLLVLQHPNRTADYPAGATEIRLKPESGMVELDMPLSHASGAYDRAKGVTWGKALSKSLAAKAGGTHGLAGGFGIGAPPVRMAAAGKRGADPDDDIEVVGGGISAHDFNEAVRRDKVLRTQVLGGQISRANPQTRYMIAVFNGENVHLTPITSLAHLRPQLHHIDAKTDVDRAVRGAGGAQGQTGQGPGAGPPGGGGNSGGGGGGTARAIHMTVKSAGAVEKDERHVPDSMADRLRQVQLEPWQRLAYVDESSDDAWALYEESLVHRGLDEQSLAAGAAASEDVKGKGKSREDEDDGEDGEGRARLADRVPALRTRWDEDELVRRISGRGGQGRWKLPTTRTTGPSAGAAAGAAKPAEKGKGKDPADKAKPGRPKGSTAATATAAGSKRGTGGSKATAMELE